MSPRTAAVLKWISLVWWALCTVVLCGAGFLAMHETSRGSREAQIELIAFGAIGPPIFHLVTCWIINRLKRPGGQG